MLVDAFHKRYPHRFFYGDRFPIEAARILAQAGHILAKDLFPILPSKEDVCRTAHNNLSREYGAGLLGDGATYGEVCLRLLFESYDLWNSRHGDQDHFFKMRIGLVELLLRGIEEHLRAQHNSSDLGLLASILSKRVKPKTRSASERLLESYTKAAEELNQRFHEANLPFTYHNGYIQLVEDDVTQGEIDAPFWKLVSGEKWRNVDYEMKEAVDRRDAGKEDAVTFALKALESTIKILSDDKGWTHGSEKGAAYYIDNLVSQNKGRYISTHGKPTR